MYMVYVDSNDELGIEKEEDEEFEFLEKRPNAHKGPITAVYFYPTCEWIISGDTYGTGNIYFFVFLIDFYSFTL